jgi:hypothetical protein
MNNPPLLQEINGNTTSNVFVTLLDYNGSGVIEVAFFKVSSSNCEVKLTLDNVVETLTITNTGYPMTLVFNSDATLTKLFDLIENYSYRLIPIWFKNKLKIEHRILTTGNIATKLIYGI